MLYNGSHNMKFNSAALPLPVVRGIPPTAQELTEAELTEIGERVARLEVLAERQAKAQEDTAHALSGLMQEFRDVKSKGIGAFFMLIFMACGTGFGVAKLFAWMADK